MSLYNRIHQLLFRSKDIIDGTGIYSRYRKLRHEQYLSGQELQTLQNQRFRRLLYRAQKHSPYYRDKFQKNGIIIDENTSVSHLPQMPLLTREDLQNHLSDILCDDASDHYINSTGGSTGNPVSFYQDRGYELFSRASKLLFYDWMGIEPGCRKAYLWGMDRDLIFSTRYEKIMIRIDRALYLNSFSMSDEKISKFLEALNKFRPHYIQGYSSSLYLIAAYINRTKPLRFRPIAIRSAAEMLFDFQRTEIEKAFGAPVYNFYGSREISFLASECPAHEGLHVLNSGRIIEIVDEEGRPLPDGTPGYLAITDLYNLAFPFIRYINGDIAMFKERPCSCGRGYKLLENIHGRSSDIIKIDGQYIHGEFFTHLFYGHPEIIQFQLIQETPTHLRLLLVSDRKDLNTDYFRNKIIERVGDNVILDIEMTDHIPVLPTGKYRFTVSKLNDGED